MLLEHSGRSREQADAWLHEVDGQFALALNDPASNELLLITDRLGMLHIYTVQVRSSVVISTSSMALAMLTQPAWDPEGCRQFLAANAILETPRTLFAGIDKLEPASIFRFARGRLRGRQRYWDLAAALDSNRTGMRGDVPRLASELRDVVAMVHRNFPHPLMDLTGGFDTRGILGAVLSLGSKFDAVVNGRDDSPDVQAAERIAREFGIRLHRRFRDFASIEQWWNQAKAALLYLDGECDVLYYARALAVHTQMAQDFDAAIVGIDGEIVQGKWWALVFPFTGWRKPIDPYVIATRRLLYDGEVPGLLAEQFPESLARHLAGVVGRCNLGFEGYPNTAQLDNAFLTLLQQRLYGRIASATQRIWPCVSPYGFRGPLETALSAPASIKVRRRMSRRLISHYDPQLAALPTESGYPALPLGLTTAHHFWPLVAEYGPLVWRRLLLQCGLQSRPSVRNVAPSYADSPIAKLLHIDEVRDLLDPSHMASRDLYDISTLRRAVEEPQVESNPGTYRLSRILTLELLARAIRV